MTADRTELSKLLAPHTPYLVLIVVLHIIGAFLQAFMISLLKPILNEALYGEDSSLILVLGTYLLIATLVVAVVFTITSYLASKISSEVTNSLRLHLMKATLEVQRMDELGGSTADTMTCLTNDVNYVHSYLFNILRTYISMPFLLIFLIFYIWEINTVMASILIGSLVLMIVVFYIHSLRFYSRYDEQLKSTDAVNNRLREKITGARTIRAYNGFDYEVSKFNVDSSKLGKVNTDISLNSYHLPLITTASMWVLVVFIFLTAALDYEGSIGASHIVLLMQYVTFLVSTLSMFSYVFLESPRARLCLNDIVRITDAGMKAKTQTGKVVMVGDKDVPLKIENMVLFKGDDDSKAIDLEVHKGEMMTFIGPNGSGAQFMFRIAAGFMSPSKGRMAICGMDVFGTDPAIIRQKVSYANSSTHLLKGTVRYNMDPKGVHSDEEILSLCESMGIGGMIRKLPKGLDTMVKDDVSSMSGGQRLLIVMVRCLLHDSELYIFDDCFFSLDPDTKEAAFRTIEERCKGRAVVFVMHDTSTCTRSDRICLMKAGKVLAQGTHDEMMEKSDLYRELYEYGQERSGTWA